MAADDKYVMNGVWLTCDKGVTPSRFNVTPKPVQLYDEHFANELDKIPLVNIMPFGVCSVTRTPCMPAPVMWERVMEEGLTVLGARPLLDTSKCMCGVGGKIAIHFTKAGATAAVELDQKLDKADELADAAEKASSWAFFGGIALAVGGAILCATGVGAPLGAAMIVGGGHLITASTILATAAAVTKGVTNFARDPSLQNGLSIVGQVAKDLVVNYVMNKLGGAVVKRLGQAAQRAMNRLGLSERACNLANRTLCSVTGHPVDVIGGYLYTEATDFEFPGPIPLRWERLWNSTSIHQGPLGSGWHHSYDMALAVDAEQSVVAFRAADGRGIAFDLVPLGQRDFNRLEKLSLLHDERGFAVLDHAQRLTYRFGVNRGDGVSPLVAIENANGFAITFAYDARGFLLEIVDSARRQLRVSCDGQGRVRTVATAHPTEPKKVVTLVQYSYNRRGELVTVTDALGQEARYKYLHGLLEQETFKNGLNFYFRYDGAGPEARCLRTWGDEGIYDHKLAYDVDNRRTTVTNSLGHEATYIGNENGLVVQFIDRRGGLHQTEYSEYNEVLSETDPLGNTTQHQYDERGNCVETQTSVAQTVRMFDENDQLTQLTDVMGNTWQWVYDAQGNLLERLGSTGLVTRYAYQNGLLGTVVEPTGRVVALHYDAGYNLQEVLDGRGIGSRALYDGWGRLRKATDERGNVQWCEHDLLNRVVQVHEPDGNVRSFAYDGLNNIIRTKDRQHEVQYAYRGMGSIVRRVEAGTAVEFVYDTEEQLRAVVNEHGLFYRFTLDAEGDVLVETGFDGLTREYVRDIGGRVTALVRPNNRRTHYTYAPTGQVAQVHYSDGSRESYRFAPNGAMLEAHNEAVSVIMVRDPLGRIITETQGEHVIESQYDAFGNRVSLRSSLGAQVTYQHSEAGDVEQMRAGTWQALFERDAQGLEMQRLLSGGVRMQWKRNALGQPIEQRISTGGRREMRQRHYSWQASNQLAQIADSSLGLTQFTHDAVGNLAATRYADGTQQLRLPDAVGNLFTTPQRQDRRYGPAGQLLEANGTQYFYDAEGNLVRKLTPTGQEWHYSWSEAGRLTCVLRPDGQLVRFIYDALGRRLSKHYRGLVTRWVWDGNVPLHEWTSLEVEEANVEDVITWLFEEDSFTPLAKLQGQQHYSLVSDHLGTPLELHGAGDAPVWAAELDSYGRVHRQQGETTACPFRYQGQYEDAETGLYYNRFRYYDPESGQYISQDPIRLAGGSGVYNYVHNVNAWIDPLGLAPCPPKRPGGHRTGDVETHGTLSPGVNRATGHTNTRADNFVQSHHPIQNEWAKRNGIDGYNEYDAPATLLRSSSGNAHAKISAMQRARRRVDGGWDTSLREEFQVSYKEMIDSGVPKAQAQKAFQKAYKYFDSIGGF